jgi:enoyl-[acyl-carrier protein] reductase I
MSFLGLEGKTVAVFGVANKKSVGYQTGRVLEEAGARVVYVAHTAARRQELARLLGDAPCLACDVEDPDQIEQVAEALAAFGPLHGFVHSIAFANYAEGFKPFHETGRQDFLQAMQISCHSLVELSAALKPHLAPDGAVVTISISTTTMAAENYGYMAPVKAALDSTVVFLAKSFSADTRVRFNAVAAGLLKTASSAGIPGYVDSYLFAEKATLRKQGLSTKEVADTAAFLLSPRASGINAQRVVVDAGMACNYFDGELVRAANRRA